MRAEALRVVRAEELGLVRAEELGLVRASRPEAFYPSIRSEHFFIQLYKFTLDTFSLANRIWFVAIFNWV